MPSPVLVRRAVFLGAVVLGASFTARATPPCPTSEELLFAVDVARIDGAQQPLKDLPPESLYLFPRNDDAGIYLAGTYDPDTGEARSLELKAAP